MQSKTLSENLDAKNGFLSKKMSGARRFFQVTGKLIYFLPCDTKRPDKKLVRVLATESESMSPLLMLYNIRSDVLATNLMLTELLFFPKFSILLG